ncbi:MAG: hypothetical protein XD76_0600 [candidate division TA06 bacterium 32_111]|uniref:Uncharacterized protein n=2 Tax=Bacteria candidate phyla TaxID=1783234 RepID=A0A101I2F9_UNCT6|nr:MAG: hypothetical protein XD76_0600 [candidate division TA06 bacterium 32_111]KUK87786.1 MAG: hypothetical protein XE03_0305 [candidate division TA06 bacterium 34_109]HAF07941.1 hypothetical protein [candidate division WOR-3 bacterium]HCP16357.1 hypothetical protein [candidate division WOR-3 bacterium]
MLKKIFKSLFFYKNKKELNLKKTIIENILNEIGIKERPDIIESMESIKTEILQKVLKNLKDTKYYKNNNSENKILLQVYLQPDKKIEEYQSIIENNIKLLSTDLEYFNLRVEEDLKEFEIKLKENKDKTFKIKSIIDLNNRINKKYVKLFNKNFKEDYAYEDLIKNNSISKYAFDLIIDKGTNNLNEILKNVISTIDKSKELLKTNSFFEIRYAFKTYYNNKVKEIEQENKEEL